MLFNSFLYGIFIIKTIFYRKNNPICQINNIRIKICYFRRGIYMNYCEKIRQSMIDGDDDSVVKYIKKSLLSGYNPKYILKNILIDALSLIAKKEEKNECLIPEVLLAMQAFKSGYKVIEPYLKEKEKDYDIIIVMGTVQGDIHDLGKNVIKMFLETLDVKIIDLGTDVPAEKFIEAIENYNANILMMSSLLTTTMSEMKKVMDMLEDRKLRQRVHVFIGGASVGESFREKIGADCYTESVVDLLDYLKKNMARIKENS